MGKLHWFPFFYLFQLCSSIAKLRKNKFFIFIFYSISYIFHVSLCGSISEYKEKSQFSFYSIFLIRTFHLVLRLPSMNFNDRISFVDFGIIGLPPLVTFKDLCLFLSSNCAFCLCLIDLSGLIRQNYCNSLNFLRIYVDSTPSLFLFEG